MSKQLTTKILAVLLCIAMVLSITACGSATPETTPATTEEKETVQEAQTAAQEPTESKRREETVTITIEVFDRGNIPEDYGTVTDNRWVTMIHDLILEELNIDVQYMAIPRWEEVTKIQALMAADAEPDIFYTYGQENVVRWADGDALADLTPYLQDGAGKHLADTLGEEVLSFGRIDGKQYAVNALRYDQGNFAAYIRKDLLDQVGVELGTLNGHYTITPSQLEDAMIKIKAAGLCEYPISLFNNSECKTTIEGAFITKHAPEDVVKGSYPTYYCIDEDGVKEAHRFLNDCYNNGLINPDFPLFDSTKLSEIIAAGQTAFWTCSYWLFMDSINAYYETNPNAEFVAVEVIHEDGTPAYFEKYAPVGAWGMVSSSCENVDAAVEVINWMMTSEEAHLIIHHGVEGEHFEYQDGKIVKLENENAGERIQLGDLDTLLNYDPCSADAEATAEATRKAYETAGYDSRVADAYLDARDIAVSEGKFVIPAVTKSVQASVDYVAELEENNYNLWIGSITAPAGKFDEVYDNYFQIYLKEGGQQKAEERLQIYLDSQK